MDILKNLNIQELFAPENLINLAEIAVIIIGGFLAVKIIAGIVKRATRKKVTPQVQMLITKSITYIGFFIVFLYALNRMGVQLAAILGAAGVVGIALGIASQESLSNIISGVFLISEKPFEIGDIITVGDKTGIIMSIDLLSVKMRTFDNLFIRIPNEKLINTEVTNITRFPIRRMDFDISVAYKEDLQKVQEVLLTIAKENPLCLDEPEPLLLFKNFGDSGIELLFAVWFEKSQYLAVKNEVFKQIKSRFDQAGIEIPFPHVTLYTGSATEPFPVKTVAKTPRR
jgi:small-conductance mechanosensitive channel